MAGKPQSPHSWLAPGGKVTSDLSRINFWRFCRLLEQHNPGCPPLGSTSHPADDPVRFSPHPGMGFPGGELKRIEYNKDDPDAPPVVRTTFLGLCGVDSPLPTAYIDDITLRREGHEALQGFLDIFNHRLMTQFYRIWRRHSYPATFDSGGEDSISQSLLGLAGLGIPGTAEHVATPVSRFLALLSVLRLPGRTEEGIRAIVQLLAPGTSVRVEPYCLRPVRIEQPAGFSGEGILLDGNTIPGDEAWDAASQLLITLSTEDENDVRSWMPDGQLFADFLAMLRVYLGWRYRARIRLKACTRLLLMPVPGEAPFWPGMNAVLGSTDDPEDMPAFTTAELGEYYGLEPVIKREDNRRVQYCFT
ncbi:type VI secretion system baseplate subunit TssG [Raoultella planticola]